MPKIKVLFEAGPMIHGQRTGVGYYIAHLVTNLGRLTPDLELSGYYFNFLGRNQEQLPVQSSIRFRRITLMPGKLLSVCRRLGFQPPLELFVRTSADLVLFTNYVSLPLARKRKVGLIVYDVSFLDYPEYTQARNLKFLQRFFPTSVKRADLIITISEFAKARLLHYFPDLQAEIVVTPIPPATSLSGPKSSLSPVLQQAGLQAHKYILYMGTIEPRKNLQNLIKAYAALDEPVRQKYALVLAGGKGWKDDAIMAEAAAATAQGMNVILTGYVSDDDKAALYHNAACFVLPSHYEGFGMPILEAMQYDLPLAISDIPVFHEVAGSAALYFNKDDPLAIAAQLATLLTKPVVAQKLSQEGLKRLATFSWQQTTDIVTQAINRVIN